MTFRNLQHYIIFIMFGCAVVLSLIFSLIAYQLNEDKALRECRSLVKNLIDAVHVSAATAVYSGNEIVGKDTINGLLSNDAVYSVTLQELSDQDGPRLKLTGISEFGGSGLDPIIIELKSPFDKQQLLGVLSVQPNSSWVAKRATETAVDIILGLTAVIFASSLISAQLIKFLISKPLVEVQQKLQVLTPASKERIELPNHLKHNEIGELVSSFNKMLDNAVAALGVERGLRKEMEVVQRNLQKAKSEAEYATQAKSDFLATMSHEIRTPMNSILGFLNLTLDDSELSDSHRRHLTIARNSAKFLLQLISDILDVSKIESGKLEVENRPFNLNGLLENIINLMALNASEKNLVLTLDIPSDLANSYIGDEFRLQQVLLNLVGNAIKFTHSGEVVLKVERKSSRHDLEFSVVDTGIGIAPDHIQKILQPFTQVDASTTRRFGGTGLGTTIASELVHLMGGELEIESELRKGSRFYFTLSLEESSQVIESHGSITTKNNNNKPLNILVVDDITENITLVKIRLERDGHTINTACNGREAYKKSREYKFDLILMDVHMPELDGVEATRLIRRGDGKNNDTPIIAMTASVMKEDESTYFTAGMNALISKPIDFPELINTLNRLTNLKLDSGHKTSSPVEEIAPSELTVPHLNSAHNGNLSEQVSLQHHGSIQDGSELNQIQRSAKSFDRNKHSLSNAKSEDSARSIISIKDVSASGLPIKLSEDGLAGSEEETISITSLNALKQACENHDPIEAEQIFKRIRSKQHAVSLDIIKQHMELFQFEQTILIIEEIEEKINLGN
ncbi:MAG: ATP-binding protein [Pseudomonadales bacterium]|nr:ATP-binding protein [Pseudomonadales bacterium]